ncbi:MAG: hypothetical protein Fur002_08950 [Anaerolineales bacterium]
MNAFLKFLQPPTFPEDEKTTRSAYYINIVTLISLPVIFTFFLIRLSLGVPLLSIASFIPIGIIAALLIIFGFIKARAIRAATYLYVIALWSASTLFLASGNGSNGAGAARYFVVIAFAGLTLGYRAAIGVAAISVASILGFAYAENVGWITQTPEPPFATAVQVIVQLVLGTTFIYLDVKSLQEAVQKEQKESRQLEKANAELRDLQASLESRVQERTDKLISANQENKRRSMQFQTISQIAQKIASEQDLDTLLSVAAEVISAQFGYQHVCIYLNDDLQEYAALRAGSSPEAKRLAETSYKVRVDPASLVGYAAKTGNSRMAADTRLEEYKDWASPFLNVQSELVLPLRAKDQTVGVLDAQSKNANAFDQTDIEALSAIASQIAIGIQSSRLLSQTQTALAESQVLYGTMVKQTWASNQEADPKIGYRYRGVKPVALDKEISTPEIFDALENGDVAMTRPSRRKTENALAIPLKLRGNAIGVIHVSLPLEEELGEDEIDVLRSASERIAIALESASLLEESQRRAKREQVIGEMSAKISANTDIESILQTTLRELGAHIRGAQIMVELENEDAQNDH